MTRAAISALVSLLLCASPCTSRTWEVFENGSGDASTVQAGIDSAAVGDTVLVGPGTYVEELDFLGKDIILLSTAGPEFTTLAAPTTTSTIVSIQNGESRACELKGFSISGGRRGIALVESEPCIVGNIIENNVNAGSFAGLFGGGNVAGPWSPLIQGNTFRNNRANLTASAIGFFSEMTPEIIDNHVYGNVAQLGDGGGIYLRTAYSGSVIRGNIVENNFAGDHGGGIYIGSVASAIDVEVSYNILWDNIADGRAQNGESGGGIWIQDTNAWVHHNTIVENTGNGPNNNYGGGIACQEPGSPLIEQNIIAYSLAGGAILCHSGVTPTIRNNLAWQNSGGPGAGLCADWINGEGNLQADPQFCDLMGGEFTLGENSPGLTHPAGPLGAFPLPGCTPTVVEAATWSSIKARFTAQSR